MEWEGLTDSGKIVFEGEDADVGLLGWVGKKGTLELGNMSDEVHMDTEKASPKKGGEVDYKVMDRLLKHELQMQLMT